MNSKDHARTQVMVVELAKQIQKLNLDEFLADLQKFDAMAPNVTLPENIRERVVPNVKAMMDLTETFIVIRDKMKTLQDTVLQTSIAHLREQIEK